MSTQMSILVAALFLSLLLVMRWTHRCWGKAFFATLFAPLLCAPIAAVVFLALAMIFKFLNEFLTGFGVRFTNATLTTVTGSTTIVLVLLLLIHYCREQRHLLTSKPVHASVRATMRQSRTFTGRMVRVFECLPRFRSLTTMCSHL